MHRHSVVLVSVGILMLLPEALWRLFRAFLPTPAIRVRFVRFQELHLKWEGAQTDGRGIDEWPQSRNRFEGLGCCYSMSKRQAFLFDVGSSIQIVQRIDGPKTMRGGSASRLFWIQKTRPEHVHACDNTPVRGTQNDASGTTGFWSVFSFRYLGVPEVLYSQK